MSDTHLPVDDGELDGEAKQERDSGANKSRLKRRQDDGVDECVRAVPEEQDERCKQDIVEHCVQDGELSPCLHLCRRPVVDNVATNRVVKTDRCDSVESWLLCS